MWFFGLFNVAKVMEHFYLFFFYKCIRNKENGTGRFMVLQIFRHKLREGLTMKMFHASFNVPSTEANPVLLCTSAEVTHLLTGDNILLPHAQAIYAPAFHRTHTQLRCCCPPTTAPQPSPAWPGRSTSWSKSPNPHLPGSEGLSKLLARGAHPALPCSVTPEFASTSLASILLPRKCLWGSMHKQRVFSILVINMHSNVCSHRSSF